MKKVTLTALLALGAALVLSAADQPVAIRAARLIDGASDTVLHRVTILVEKNKRSPQLRTDRVNQRRRVLGQSEIDVSGRARAPRSPKRWDAP